MKKDSKHCEGCGGNGGREKIDLNLLEAASHRDLAHWVVILDLDPEKCKPDDTFIDWLKRCGVDVREMDDEEGVVVRRPDKPFLFIPPPALEACSRQFDEIKTHWCGKA